jgi:hypothetical protein
MKNQDERMNGNGYSDDFITLEFLGKTEVNKNLSDVNEEEDEGDESIGNIHWPTSTPNWNQKSSNCIWSEVKTYDNPWADEIANIIKNTRQCFFSMEENRMMGNRKNDAGKGAKWMYSDSFSQFSTYPNGEERKRMKFTNNASYTDSCNSFSVDRPQRNEPDFELFARYEREVKIEQRLINKVCQDQELSDLILNLYKYQYFFRNAERQLVMEGEKSKGYLDKPLYPRNLNLPFEEKDVFDSLRKIEIERDHYKKETQELKQKIGILGKIQTQLITNWKNLESKKADLEQELQKLKLCDDSHKESNIQNKGTASGQKPIMAEHKNKTKRVKKKKKSKKKQVEEESKISSNINTPNIPPLPNQSLPIIPPDKHPPPPKIPQKMSKGVEKTIEPPVITEEKLMYFTEEQAAKWEELVQKMQELYEEFVSEGCIDL